MIIPLNLTTLYCQLLTYFAPCSSVVINNFEHVIADWLAIFGTRGENGRVSSWKTKAGHIFTENISCWSLIYKVKVSCMDLFLLKFSLFRRNAFFFSYAVYWRNPYWQNFIFLCSVYLPDFTINFVLLVVLFNFWLTILVLP